MLYDNDLALHQFQKSHHKILVNTCLNRDEQSSLNFKLVKGFAKSITKLMANGKFADIVDTTKSNLKYLRELI